MTIFKRLSLILILTFALGACANGGVSSYPVPESRADYVLGVGDILRITVFGQENLSGEFTVEQGGDISLPLIRKIPVSGMTAQELASEITDRLSPDYVVDPRVSVEVMNYRNMYVLGEVQSPGKYEYAPNMTVLQAVALAGGYTYRANESSAEVSRHVKGAINTFTVNDKTLLKPGDTIVIKRRWF